ncbi:dTDP-4-dehydrorhamnose reductase [Fodinibius salinus]|uniref:dTDP-4-dehydrorhamnose reductase n=1 Tax=Fodinibius salinus TaxID=860790 RepID=A0A5D3YRM6_9BACT|nr:dTDP-4-dehydrorhamnose reductase [Fodinibius salinus]TYP95653.1 dTDP-4-dehydrorhamnose reductase [Fodinibius salinus]
MKVVLLGASGQLGREWQDFIERQDEDEFNLLAYTSDDLDITHYQQVSDELRKQKPDLVVNCAAYTDVDGAEDHRKLAQKVNVEAVLYLAELSQELEFKLLHYSTDYVFPGSKLDRRAMPEGYPEDYPADPINWYGRTKWEGEQAIRNTSSNYLILRLSWVCGQYGSNFVKTMLELGRERDKLQVVNDQWGSPSFTTDIVRNSIALINAEATGTYHYTSKGLISWYDFAEKIFTLSDINVEVESVDSDTFSTKAPRPHFSKLNTRKITAELGEVVDDWEEGLIALLEQLKKR